MSGTLIITDLEQLYLRTFGNKPYQVSKAAGTGDDGGGFKITSSGGGNTSDLLTKDAKGVDVWLPIYMEDLPADIGDNGTISLLYATIRISSEAIQVKTPLAERIGSAKEQYSVDDYKILIKGFFIDKEFRSLPEKDLEALKKLMELGKSFKIRNKLTDIFLSHTSLPATEQNRVVIKSFELMEVERGRISMRPFTMQLESDCIFTLEIA